jgi:hypothetical protein
MDEVYEDRAPLSWLAAETRPAPFGGRSNHALTRVPQAAAVAAILPHFVESSALFFSSENNWANTSSRPRALGGGDIMLRVLYR